MKRDTNKGKQEAIELKHSFILTKPEEHHFV